MSGSASTKREIEDAAMERLRRQLEKAVLDRLRRGEARALVDEEVLRLAAKLDRMVVRRMANMAAAPHRPSDDAPDG